MPAAKKSKTKRIKRAAPKQDAARKRATAMATALAEAAWAEADVALAEALADLDELISADSAQRADALAVLAQSLSRAARKRGLTRIGALDAREPYDAAVHDLRQIVAKKPKTVRIQARGVARGGQVLVKPRVGAIRAKARRKTRT
ncbi:hypothetical protein [Terricaulis silvestris]|uniref:Uncharacterized protein n=1 Tax=Terricaulis silvestris TaxID=2686094 RepID=A0A6I6MMW2_9CAUL|nr:hypothetical protein [Terricaulis silvestris]QGZ94067.1 hypothetical protein DSM104635_00883 [Terricaulis silvestris]